MTKSEIKEIMDQLPKSLTEDWIEQAIAKFDKSKMSIDQRADFEIMLAKNASIIQMQKEEKERIRKEAEEQGKKISEKRGEKRKALEIGKKLKEFGIEAEIIMEATGLTLKEIEQLLMRKQIITDKRK